MKPPVLDRMWETFLRVGEKRPEDVESASAAVVRDAEDNDLAAALAVLRALREHVLPLIRRLEERGVIDWYSFLVHGQECVPTEDVSGVYIHLRLSLTSDFNTNTLTLPEPWCMTRRMTGVDMGGVAVDKLLGGLRQAWKLHGEQATWLFEFLEQHEDEPATLYQLGQYLHYLSNMTQMRVA